MPSCCADGPSPEGGRRQHTHGSGYAEAFADWKKAFGFPDGKEHAVLYTNAIVCAERRVFADEIIAELSLKQKMDMGISASRPVSGKGRGSGGRAS